MAKRKTRKTKAKEKPSYINELYGILLILISIFGICKYGIVGRIIASFSLFLVGNLYCISLIVLFIIGILVVINRKSVNLFSSKMVGIYLFSIAVLIFMHQEYLSGNVNVSNVFSDTVDNVILGINKVMNGSIKTGVFNPVLENTGGGIFGAIFSSLCYSLFDSNGTRVVTIVLFISGFMIFTGLSIKDILDKSKEGASKLKSISHERVSSSDDDEDDKVDEVNPKIVDHNDDKLVVHDIKELSKAVPTKEQVAPKLEDSINKSYELPSIELLDAPKKVKKTTNHSLIEKDIEKLEQVLKDFGISGKVVEVNIGPSITQYELSLSSGTRVSKLLTINKEISLALAKKDVRIQAPIPGKSTVGIELPNEEAQPVSIRETLELMPKSMANKPLAVALGKDIMGNVQFCEIDKTPHLLIAGSTGSGKSVCINTMLASILMKARPDEVKLIMVDPKKVELGIYNGIPHLLTPVVTDPKKASIALKRAVSEMERRYDLFEECKVKNITGYNEMIEDKNKKLPDTEKLAKMPYIVVIVDELADLMLVAKKEVEDSIMRITQMARAAGIHLIVATQRPSTNVITGVIKANIPSRIAFAVSSNIDSRTILDKVGAEKLLGKGDMLFLPMGKNAPDRIQGAFIDEKQVKKLVDHTVAQQKAQFDNNFMNLDSVDAERKENPTSGDVEEYDDPLYNEIVEFVITSGKASASLLQRRFKVGYNRAARIIDLLEERGIIGAQNGSKPREVLVKLESEDN